MDVLVLVQQRCGLCDQAKQVLERLSSEFPIALSTLDLDTAEGQVLATQGGILFPPGVFLDGQPFCYGRLSERRLRQEIERRLRLHDGTSHASNEPS